MHPIPRLTATESTPPHRATTRQELLIGARMLGHGFGAWRTHPRIMLVGAIPVAIVAVIYTIALVWWLMNLSTTVDVLLPFINDWPSPWRTIGTVVATLALIAIGGVAVVFTFSAVVLFIAGPFLDHISSRIERELGGVNHPGPNTSFFGDLGRAIVDSLRLIALGLMVSLLVFVCGLVPIVGTIAGWCLGAIIGGFALALEFTGTPAAARGIRFRQRRRMLREHRARTIGFGALTYVIFLLPLGAVIAAPAAAVGATLLVRSMVGEPTSSPAFAAATRRVPS